MKRINYMTNKISTPIKKSKKKTKKELLEEGNSKEEIKINKFQIEQKCKEEGCILSNKELNEVVDKIIHLVMSETDEEKKAILKFKGKCFAEIILRRDFERRNENKF